MGEVRFEVPLWPGLFGPPPSWSHPLPCFGSQALTHTHPGRWKTPAIWWVGQPMKKRGRVKSRQNSAPSRQRTLQRMGPRRRRLTRMPPTTMPTMAEGMERQPMSMLA